MPRRYVWYFAGISSVLLVRSFYDWQYFETVTCGITRAPDAIRLFATGCSDKGLHFTAFDGHASAKNRYSSKVTTYISKIVDNCLQLWIRKQYRHWILRGRVMLAKNINSNVRNIEIQAAELTRKFHSIFRISKQSKLLIVFFCIF